jgi:hypothetical protein
MTNRAVIWMTSIALGGLALAVARPADATSRISAGAWGLPGQWVSLRATLFTDETVRGVEYTLQLDPSAPIGADLRGEPDCTVFPDDADRPGVGRFTFEPAGCTPEVDCTQLQAAVYSADPETELGNYTALFACRIRVPAPPEPTSSTYILTLPCVDLWMLAQDGKRIDIPCADAIVRVYDATPAEVLIGDAEGSPGDSVFFPVTLLTQGDSIAGLQVDLTWDTDTPLGARPNGRPDCRVAQGRSWQWEESGQGSGGKGPQVSFSFRPPACMYMQSCTGMRAIWLAIDNTDPIADGVLYWCRVEIAENTLSGSHPLRCSNLILANPTGQGLIGACRDGSITVFGGSPCRGDCDGNGEVTIDELVMARLILLEMLPASSCPAADADRDGTVTVDEIVSGVQQALQGCTTLP